MPFTQIPSAERRTAASGSVARRVSAVAASSRDRAVASAILARSFPTAWDGIMARTYGPPGLEADIEFCSQENTIDVVPRFARMVDGAAEILA